MDENASEAMQSTTAPATEVVSDKAGVDPNASAVSVQPPEFEDASKTSGAATNDRHPSLDIVLDVPVTLSLEVGSATMSVGELLKLGQGAVVELDRAVGEPLDVMVNGALVAHGEIVLVNDKFGIRLTSIIEPAGRSSAEKQKS